MSSKKGNSPARLAALALGRKKMTEKRKAKKQTKGKRVKQGPNDAPLVEPPTNLIGGKGGRPPVRPSNSGPNDAPKNEVMDDIDDMIKSGKRPTRPSNSGPNDAPIKNLPTPSGKRPTRPSNSGPNDAPIKNLPTPSDKRPIRPSNSGPNDAPVKSNQRLRVNFSDDNDNNLKKAFKKLENELQRRGIPVETPRKAQQPPTNHDDGGVDIPNNRIFNPGEISTSKDINALMIKDLTQKHGLTVGRLNQKLNLFSKRERRPAIRVVRFGRNLRKRI